MPQRASILIIIIFICLILVVIIEPVINKQKDQKITVLKNIVMYIVIPTTIGIITAYFGTVFFSQDNYEWNNNISSNDEQILKENGIKDLDGYYVRVNETDQKLETKGFAPFFKRIDTRNQLKSKKFKYRYLEVISKNRNVIPSEVWCYLDKGNEYILSTNNTLGKYLDEFVFFSKSDKSVAKYYLYEVSNTDIQYYNVEIIDQGICTEHCNIQEINNSENSITVGINSEIELKTGTLANSKREYIGYINNMNYNKKQNYYYEQTIKIEDTTSTEKIVIFDENVDPGLFDNKNNVTEKIVLMNHKAVSNEKNEYYYLGSEVVRNLYRPMTMFYYIEKHIN